MRKNYEQPIIQLVTFEEADIVRTSFGEGDNIIEDGFFD